MKLSAIAKGGRPRHDRSAVLGIQGRRACISGVHDASSYVVIYTHDRVGVPSSRRIMRAVAPRRVWRSTYLGCLLCRNGE